MFAIPWHTMRSLPRGSYLKTTQERKRRMKRDNNKNMLITDAESYRNTMMLAFYGLEDRIKKSKTAADYIDLIRRTGMLAEAMANVLAKTGENNETLNRLTAKRSTGSKKFKTRRRDTRGTTYPSSVTLQKRYDKNQ